MREFTQVINHSSAPSVTTNALTLVILRGMNGPTMDINHSVAHSVTTNAQVQVI